MNDSTNSDKTTMVIPQENDVLLELESNNMKEGSHPGTSFYWRKIQEFTNKRDQKCTDENNTTTTSCTSSASVSSSNYPDPAFLVRNNQAEMILQQVTSQKPPGRFLQRSEDTHSRNRITNNDGIWEVLDNERRILSQIMAHLKHYQDRLNIAVRVVSNKTSPVTVQADHGQEDNNVPTQPNITENHLIDNDSNKDEYSNGRIKGTVLKIKDNGDRECSYDQCGETEYLSIDQLNELVTVTLQNKQRETNETNSNNVSVLSNYPSPASIPRLLPIVPTDSGVESRDGTTSSGEENSQAQATAPSNYMDAQVVSPASIVPTHDESTITPMDEIEEEEEEEEVNCITPQDNDVMLSDYREDSEDHQGTCFYWKKVDECSSESATDASSMTEQDLFEARRKLSLTIIQDVYSQEPSGRFLDRATKNNNDLWTLMDEEESIIAKIIFHLKHYHEEDPNNESNILPALKAPSEWYNLEEKSTMDQASTIKVSNILQSPKTNMQSSIATDLKLENENHEHDNRDNFQDNEKAEEVLGSKRLLCPRENDVCHGTGSSQLTPGNKLYRELIELNGEEYGRTGDHSIIENIVGSIYKQHGRFLCALNDEADHWEELSQCMIVKKVKGSLKRYCRKVSNKTEKQKNGSSRTSRILPDTNADPTSLNNNDDGTDSDDTNSSARTENITLRDHDVICGKACTLHPGNQHYYQLLFANCKQYQNAPDDSIIDSILETFGSLQPPGRFLKQYGPNQEWEMFPEDKIREKIHFALVNNDNVDGRMFKNDVTFDKNRNFLHDDEEGKGNAWFIAKIEEFSDDNRRSIKDKSSFAKDIMNVMKAELYPPARFLIKTDNNNWKVISLDEEIEQQIIMLLESTSNLNGRNQHELNNSSSDDKEDENRQCDSEEVSSTHDEESSTSSATYRSLGEHDVICGRGGHIVHPGNQHYYQLIDATLQYDSNHKSIDRIMETFENLQPRGRFLIQRNTKWQELPEDEIRRKIRDSLGNTRRKNKGIRPNNNDVGFDEDENLMSADEDEENIGNAWLVAKINEHSGKGHRTVKDRKSIVNKIMNAMETEAYPPIRFLKASKESWIIMSKEEIEKQILDLLKSTSSTIKEDISISDVSSVASSDTISTPEEHDVICGRNNSSVTKNHPGNHHYHQLIEQYREEYRQEDCDDSIVNIIIDTFANLEPTGRFLDRCSSNGKCKELSREKIKAKIHRSMTMKKKQLVTRPNDENDVKFDKSFNLLNHNKSGMKGYAWLVAKIEEYNDERHMNRKEKSIINEIMDTMKTGREIYPPVRFFQTNTENKWKVMSKDNVRRAIKQLLSSIDCNKKLEEYKDSDAISAGIVDSSTQFDKTRGDLDVRTDDLSDDDSMMSGKMRFQSTFVRYPKRRCNRSKHGGSKKQMIVSTKNSSERASSEFAKRQKIGTVLEDSGVRSNRDETFTQTANTTRDAINHTTRNGRQRRYHEESRSIIEARHFNEGTIDDISTHRLATSTTSRRHIASFSSNLDTTIAHLHRDQMCIQIVKSIIMEYKRSYGQKMKLNVRLDSEMGEAIIDSLSMRKQCNDSLKLHLSLALLSVERKKCYTGYSDCSENDRDEADYMTVPERFIFHLMPLEDSNQSKGISRSSAKKRRYTTHH